MSLGRKTRTEHTGAKNGGGYWGTREEAKEISKKLRRENKKREIKKEVDYLEKKLVEITND